MFHLACKTLSYTNVELVTSSGRWSFWFTSTMFICPFMVICHPLRIRAYMQVCMNCNGNGYQETTSNSLNETELFVTSTLNRRSRLVQPIITPRFAPTCDEELLMGLGDIAKKYDVRYVLRA